MLVDGGKEVADADAGALGRGVGRNHSGTQTALRFGPEDAIGGNLKASLLKEIGDREPHGGEGQNGQKYSHQPGWERTFHCIEARAERRTEEVEQAKGQTLGPLSLGNPYKNRGSALHNHKALPFCGSACP